jgi:ribosome-binding factor A
MEFDFTLPGLGKPQSSRPKRVAEAIKNELSTLLLRDVADPRLDGVSFSQVVLSPDLKQAKVYFTIPAGDKPRSAGKALKRARGFFRSRLAKALDLRYTPDLVFYFDKVNEEMERIDELFRQIGKDQKKDDERN